MNWTVLIPVKGGPDAKSRLPETVRGIPRGELAAALAADTIAAALPVASVLVVTGGPGVEIPAGTREHRQREGAGLNAALAEAAATVSGPVAVLLGDLPALRPEDLEAALAACAAVGRGVVDDAQGTGTTLLAAAHGGLSPAFGEGSFARHLAGGYVRVEASERLRADVDSEADLARVEALGVGPRTAAALARTRLAAAR